MTDADTEARLDAAQKELTLWPLAQAEHGIAEALGVPLKEGDCVPVGFNNLVLARRLAVEPYALHMEDSIIADGLPEERVDKELGVAGRAYRELKAALDRLASNETEQAWGGVKRQRAVLRGKIEQLRANARAVSVALASRTPRNQRGAAVHLEGLDNDRVLELKSQATTPMGGAYIRRDFANGRVLTRVCGGDTGVLSIALNLLRLSVGQAGASARACESTLALSTDSEEYAAHVLNHVSGLQLSPRVWREALRRGIGHGAMRSLFVNADSDDKRVDILSAARVPWPLECAEEAIATALDEMTEQPLKRCEIIAVRTEKLSEKLSSGATSLCAKRKVRLSICLFQRV